MRFQVSRVMDAIEQRLTTDVTLAQAVVDLAEVARCVELDKGRPINLLRVGMVVDALGRYLIDAGSMLYPVTGRELLSEAALTSKERMVLGRWADDGLIEVTPVVGDRAVEIADFTGMPLISVRDLRQYAARFPWLVDSPERMLRLVPRAGGAVLRPGGDTLKPKPEEVPAVVVGKAALPVPEVVVPAVVDVPHTSDEEPKAGDDPRSEEAAQSEGESKEGVAPKAEDESKAEGDSKEGVAPKAEGEPKEGVEPKAEVEVKDPAVAAAERREALETFKARGAQRFSRTRVVRRRFTRAEPSAMGVSLMARQWLCREPGCPAFSDFRRIGQPVPRMRGPVPACPKHGEAVKDIGARPPAFAIAVVVDDLARRRFVVNTERPVIVGRDPGEPDEINVGDWLHEAAADWIGKQHLRLEVQGDELVVTDTSENGTLIWKRTGPDDHGTSERLYRRAYTLSDWDSLELYTGVELVRGDRRLATVVGSEPASVLLDAPTVALRLVD